MVNEILQEREKTHGSYKDNAALGMALIKLLIEDKNWNNITPEAQLALLYIQGKISRVLSSSDSNTDNWVDIAGYATLRINSYANEA
jgi:hypothetical protein